MYTSNVENLKKNVVGCASKVKHPWIQRLEEGVSLEGLQVVTTMSFIIASHTNSVRLILLYLGQITPLCQVLATAKLSLAQQSKSHLVFKSYMYL